MRYNKVIFCSRDCTYRAPVAAEVLRKYFVDKCISKDIEICAKGMVVMFPEPVNGKAIAIGKSKGYDLSEYGAKAITNDDFSVDTLVLVMTGIGKQKIYDAYDKAINVYTVKEFVGKTGDIEIPFGRSLADYGESFNQLEDLVKQVAEKVVKMD